MVSKTRDILIEVARQLFARKGIENTTMNDIAEASDKGRRTIYTYFKNKREIYNAVVQSESSQMLARLQELLKQPLTPEQKLMNFIFIRFESVKEIVLRNGSLRAGFFRDVRKVERARRSTSAQEFSILKQILSEGVQKGMFRIKHIDQTTTIMLYSLHGLDVPYIRNDFSEMGIERMTLREYIRDFIMNGIKKQ
ncbi:MAG: TetR family transcriptional regulator [Bacteroidales bacterium]|nr:TetR family transcriptional regulator [Bacteroidales bacterium]MDY2930650.1 TetR family transcriptional regulator [Muribaculaceae bacterium]MDD6131153.1 TetR family transcriptional regulator [Bacteroidales bacterium]MDD6851334.1 TetR family transcriptional regulator [Bacteroidales bacterium]MDD7405503.1 TetR family transcriptional regulator [Bacteroidales bacterium]